MEVRWRFSSPITLGQCYMHSMARYSSVTQRCAATTLAVLLSGAGVAQAQGLNEAFNEPRRQSKPDSENEMVPDPELPPEEEPAEEGEVNSLSEEAENRRIEKKYREKGPTAEELQTMSLPALEAKRDSISYALPLLLTFGGLALSGVGLGLQLDATISENNCGQLDTCSRGDQRVAGWTMLIASVPITTAGILWWKWNADDQHILEEEIQRRKNAEHFSFGVAPTRGGSMFTVHGRF